MMDFRQKNRLRYDVSHIYIIKYILLRYCNIEKEYSESVFFDFTPD